jgi:hypothetical protein
LFLVDETKRAVGLDHLSQVALEQLIVIGQAFHQLDVAAKIRFGNTRVTFEGHAVNRVAGTFLDQKIDLQFRHVRRPDQLAADTSIKESLLFVEAPDGGDVVIDQVRVEGAVTKDEDVRLGLDLALELAFGEAAGADEVDVADAYVGAFDDVEDQLPALRQGGRIDIDMGERVILSLVQIFYRLLGDGKAETVDGLSHRDVHGALHGRRIDFEVAAKGDRADLLLLGHDEHDDHTDDPVDFGRLDLGLDVGELPQAENSLVIFLNGCGVELVAFTGADQVEDDGGGDGGVTQDTNLMNRPAHEVYRRRDRRRSLSNQPSRQNLP